MENLYIAISALGVSVALNVWLFVRQKSTKRKLATDARAMLHDLTNGGAFLKVTVIDPDGLMIYKGHKQ